MQDRYLFRVWDKRNKRFMYRGIYDRNWYTKPHGGKCYCGIHPSDEYEYSPYEQCTGFKDIHNQLIFEGDVLKPIFPENTDRRLYVKWHGLRYCLFHIKKIFDSEFYSPQDYIIIGNIHENLKKEV